MSIPPGKVEVGKCYLIGAKHVWRVVCILPDGRIQYEARLGYQTNATIWKFGTVDGPSFTSQVEREIACDWTPEADGEHL